MQEIIWRWPADCRRYRMEDYMGTIERIKEKLNKEEKGGKFDRYAAVMKGYVKGALLTLCEQSERFAAAVLDGDTFEDCMKEVAKNVGSSISDLEAVKRAVKFYMKGADVSFQMVIQERGEKAAAEKGRAGTEDAQGAPLPEKKAKKAEVIDLTDFF